VAVVLFLKYCLDFPDSIIVGVDKDMGRLEKVVEKRLKNVIPVKADITEKVFPDRTFEYRPFRRNPP